MGLTCSCSPLQEAALEVSTTDTQRITFSLGNIVKFSVLAYLFTDHTRNGTVSPRRPQNYQWERPRGPSTLKPGSQWKTNTFYFACFLKAEPLGLKALTIPLPKLPKGEAPGTRRGEQEHTLKHIQPWLYAYPMTSNSRVLLGYRWAQSVMQAWSVPRPAAKMRYPWKEGIL